MINSTCVKNYIKFCAVQKNFEECLLCENGLIKDGDCVNSDTCQNVDPKCRACYYEEIQTNSEINSQTGIESQNVTTSNGIIYLLNLILINNNITNCFYIFFIKINFKLNAELVLLDIFLILFLKQTLKLVLRL